MIKRLRLPRSLDAKMLYLSVLGLLTGLIVYFAVNYIGGRMIETYYMSDAQVSRRKVEIISEFSDYVSRYSLSGQDSAGVARFTGEHEYVTIVLYNKGSQFIHYSGGQASSADDRAFDPSQYGRLYTVHFKDGLYQVAVLDGTQAQKYNLVYIISFALGCAAFIALTLLYARRLTRRIVELSREAAEVSSGDLQRSIEADGDDEIAALALSMDEMRRSVIERMGNESRAWQANTELITAISHDIRTPMTSMIGYLGLLTESELGDKDRQFADSAYAKAMELKYLTDELFRYFLVFGKAELAMDVETLDGRLLWEQLISEAEYDMSDSGFTVKCIDFDGDCTVEADPMYLMRVLNNLVSNVKKYADPERPVVVLSELREGRLSMCVSNGIARELPKTESTKIGLMTCRKIMERMGGSFETRSDAEHFAAELTIPARTIQE